MVVVGGRWEEGRVGWCGGGCGRSGIVHNIMLENGVWAIICLSMSFKP